jgi:periplasmic protein TonB
MRTIPGHLDIAHDKRSLDADPLGAVVAALARPKPAQSLPAEANLGNVIVLFAESRAPSGTSPAISVGRDERPAPPPNAADRLIVVFLAASLAVHAGIAAIFNRAPPPLASIGVVSITAEIVLGADVPAGLANTPNPSEAAANSTPSPDQSDDMAKREVARAEMKRTDEPATVEQHAAYEPPPPAPDALVPEPVNTASVPAEIAPRPAEAVEPAPMTKPPEPKVEQPKRETARRAAEHVKRKAASVASVASSGVGRGRSDAGTNYRGIVAAHLARHKQNPPDARAQGEEGSATVSFSIDGAGRVTRVALTRHAGVASLDQESLAMVRRASPFPPPPAGQAMSFTVPVSFALRSQSLSDPRRRGATPASGPP